MTDIITRADKLKCALRELEIRKINYARRVAEDKMSPGKAAHEIACMEAIAADYQDPKDLMPDLSSPGGGP